MNETSQVYKLPTRAVMPTSTKKIHPHIISVTSGKGGVGKTLSAINLAISAKRMGFSPLLIDGDFGLANVDVVLGLQARYNINDVINGHAKLEDIILEGPLGIKIIPSGSGIARLTNFSYIQKLQLLESVSALKCSYDLIIIDTGAGISRNVLYFNSMADQVVIVTTPEPHAMTDAYAMIKILKSEHGKNSMGIVVNMAKSEKEALNVSERMSEVSRKFLNARVEYFGYVPSDPQVEMSVGARQAASEASISTLAGQAWNEVSRNVLQGVRVGISEVSEQFVWKEMLSAPVVEDASTTIDR